MWCPSYAFLPSSPTSSLSVVSIGINRTLYRVIESVGAVEVCASVRRGVTLDREVVVHYGTVNKTGVGMGQQCIIVNIILSSTFTFHSPPPYHPPPLPFALLPPPSLHFFT